MLAIQQKGLGVDKGIPTLGVAAISIDDALAVAAFGVVYGITFATGTLAMSILQGPLEVLMGFAYGIIVGILLWYLPHGKAVSNRVLADIYNQSPFNDRLRVYIAGLLFEQ